MVLSILVASVKSGVNNDWVTKKPPQDDCKEVFEIATELFGVNVWSGNGRRGIERRRVVITSMNCVTRRRNN